MSDGMTDKRSQSRKALTSDQVDAVQRDCKKAFIMHLVDNMGKSSDAWPSEADSQRSIYGSLSRSFAHRKLIN